MIILKYFINSLDALWRNKLRSALSTLGIVIGVASVSIMMALGEGLKEKMLENLSTSNDTITITEKNTWGGREEETQDKPYFQVKEVMVPSSIELLKKFIPDIKYVIGYGNGYGGSSQFEGKELYSSIVGVSSDYFKAKKLEILAGRGFTNKDFEETKKVVILGSEVVKYNLNGVNPVGKVIMIGGYA
ncbi:MAG: ABC transporter permease, partial [Candidatus Gracilibacteria bacterium]|nr:ABC transporter permease [Candidatus Gracilibacteria bacterium]